MQKDLIGNAIPRGSWYTFKWGWQQVSNMNIFIQEAADTISCAIKDAAAQTDVRIDSITPTATSWVYLATMSDWSTFNIDLSDLLDFDCAKVQTCLTTDWLPTWISLFTLDWNAVNVWDAVTSTVASVVDNQEVIWTWDNTTQAFTLSNTPLNWEVQMFINGVYQNKATYTLVWTTVTFWFAPTLWDVISAYYIITSTWPVPQQWTLWTWDWTTTVFTLPFTPVNNNPVIFINGAYQIKGTDFTVTWTTVTFTSAPVWGDDISYYLTA